MGLPFAIFTSLVSYASIMALCANTLNLKTISALTTYSTQL